MYNLKRIYSADNERLLICSKSNLGRFGFYLLDKFFFLRLIYILWHCLMLNRFYVFKLNYERGFFVSIGYKNDFARSLASIQRK